MAKAETNISWLPMHVVVRRVARHLSCTPEDAQLRIVGKAKAAWVRACGVTSEGYPVSPLPASWRGIDWDAGSLSCEITNIKLCLDDLIAADLLAGRSEGRKGGAAQTLADHSKRWNGPLRWARKSSRPNEAQRGNC